MGLVLIGVMLAQAVGPVWAEEPGATQPEDTRVVDSIKAFDYEEYLGNSLSTQYSGRVWADKWVSNSDVVIPNPTGEAKQYVVNIGEEDFLVGYSLHTAATAVSGQSLVPLDVVLVIDISSTMLRHNRIQETVKALNETVETLLAGNPNTRVGVVVFSTEATTLLPLGRYKKAAERDSFFWLEQQTDKDPNGEYKQHLYVSAISDENKLISGYQDVYGWTNIHMAIDTGMDMLREATTKTEDGQQRYPALMLMSDGEPTCAGSNDSVWWDPSGVEGKGYADTTGLQAFKAIMNAAYQKQKVNSYYDVDMQVYTVGVEIEKTSTGDPEPLAEVTLDPKGNLKETSDNYYGRQMWEDWQTYLTNPEGVEVGPWGEKYTFTHPPAEDDITSLHYNDDYLSVEDASEISAAFQQIIEEFSVALSSPTEVEGDPTTSGYVTYTDDIGEYMEVTGVCLLWYGAYPYTYPDETKISEGVTEYRFFGYPWTPAYGAQRLMDICTTVTTNADGNQTLTVEVPAALLPMRANILTYLEVSGEGVTQTVTDRVMDNIRDPMRLFYTVSLRDGVLNPDGTVNTDVVSPEYIQANSNPDGTVNFYSNRYSKNTMSATGETLTVGDANVTFTPASNNAFYVFQEDVPLYTDEGCTKLATEANRNDQILYYPVEYYQAVEDGGSATLQKQNVTCYLGDYAQTRIKTDEVTGQLYITKGTLRGLSDAVVKKGQGENLTNTAATFRYPDHNNSGQVQLQLGANGKLTAPLSTGSLTVSKEVEGTGANLNQEFTFTVTCTNNNAPLTGTYTYTGGVLQGYENSVVAPEAGSLTLDTSGKGTITLKHGQTITIQGLPRTATYTVKETPVANYTPWVGKTQTDTTTGTVGGASTAAFTNIYAIPYTNVAFTKVDGTGFDPTQVTEDDYLRGAEFALYRYTGTNWDGVSGSLLDTQNLGNDWKAAGKQISGDQGLVTFSNLEAGHYRLVETKAPGGFQLPKGQWNVEVTITNNVGSFTILAVEEATSQTPGVVADNGTYYLMNYKPTQPPITGGDGGRSYWMVGG
ncbi:hypothetical protein B5G37_14120, partial [Pseudoflavonifractor sp. An85]